MIIPEPPERAVNNSMDGMRSALARAHLNIKLLAPYMANYKFSLCACARHYISARATISFNRSD